MSESNLIEINTMELPASFCIKKAAGDRYQVVIMRYDNGALNEEYYNFYDDEHLYVYVNQGKLTGILTSKKEASYWVIDKIKEIMHKCGFNL